MSAPATARYTGIASYEFGPTQGVLHRFRTPADVLEVFDDDLDDVVALVESGGTTFLSPILGRLRGIVCTSGTTRSHLAIVSREYAVPCLLAVDLHGDDAQTGDLVTMELESGGAGTLTVGAHVGHPAEAETGSADTTAGADRAPLTLGNDRDTETSGSASTDWWNYIRRTGDDIARKPFPASVDASTVAALCAESLTDERLDDLIGHMGRSFKPELTRRSGFTSEIFPMLPYMAMSTIEDFHTYPERVRIIDAARPAEVIGAQLRQRPGLISPLWIWMVGYHYLCGREQLIGLGKLRPDEDIDDVRTVVDFWRRLTLAYRGDGTLDYKDAGFTNRYLPDAQVDRLRASIDAVDPTTARDLQQLNATLSGYAFMYFTDSRVGICDHGPYPDGADTALLVRDFLCLDSGQFSYPWAADCDPGVSGITLTLRFPLDAFDYFEINDWGTTFTEPDQLLSTVTHASVIAHHADGTESVVTPDRWSDLGKRVGTEHVRLYRHFSDMPRPDRIFSATRMYSWGLRPFATLVGVDDAIDWSISPATMALYPDPLDDDDRAAAIFGGALVAHDRPSSFSPILHPSA
ncbi:hypothetical protein GPOL_c00750 [Gordonia polyisoprenivorans VH2]|uniref:PEP-utilising enzyme mobile domain-containing protein n=1 Tax=Gordonia polyisoprenivorans (strain DSM 44266 / VH2) TaxID=1112204 RepID=H6N3B2_GORPV|nr:PEP-utilizing enzyme [Gordonia polyisoprenivorans]AFA71151.1 hypothetical protein GPOL_c00750 [Gordonia polyisoprenivorans VH2]